MQNSGANAPRVFRAFFLEIFHDNVVDVKLKVVEKNTLYRMDIVSNFIFPFSIFQKNISTSWLLSSRRKFQRCKKNGFFVNAGTFPGPVCLCSPVQLIVIKGFRVHANFV